MNKFQLALKSRTFWTLIVMFLYNVINVYGAHMSPSLSSLVNLVLGALATYFKLNPSSNYNSPAVQAQPITPGQ